MAYQNADIHQLGHLKKRSQQSSTHELSIDNPAAKAAPSGNRILLALGLYIFLICGPLLCLAAEQQADLILTKEQKAALANAKTWKILVQVDYGAAKAYEGLPIVEDCRRLLQYGGWQVVDREATSFDVLLEVRVEAAPKRSSYIFGGDRYDTARIETSGQIKLHGQPIVTLAKAEHRHDAYYDAFSGFLAREPDGAPFILAYYFNAKFFNQLLSLLYQTRGFAPIKSAISDPVSVKDRQMHDWTLRGVALNAVDFAGQTKDTHFLDDLNKVLLADEEWLLRKHAAEALGTLGQPGAVEPLCQTLLTDKKEKVRQASAEALGELGHVDGAEALCQALATDEDDAVQKVAARSLGKVGGQRAVQALIAALRSGNVALVDIVDSLHKLDWQPESVADQVLFLLAKGSSQGLDDEQRVRQLQALGDEAIPHLIEALEHPVSAVNERSLTCLGQMKYKAAVEPMCNILATGNTTQRRAAASALGEIGDKDALDTLLQALLTDTDPWARVATAEALGKIGDANATNGLVQALTDSSENVREAVFKALGSLNWQPTTIKEKVWSWIGGGKPDDVLSFGQEAAPIVLELLERDDSTVQRKAMELAGKLKLTEAIDPISKMMVGDNNSRIRADAARALGKIGWAEALAALSQALLNDKEKDVRAAAAEAMGVLKDPKAVQSLLKKLDDEDVGVRKAVVQALGAFAGDEVEKALRNRFQQEKDAAIKQAIFDILSKLQAAIEDLPFEYTAHKLAKEKKVMKLKALLKQQPLQTLVELLKSDNRVLTNAAGFELMQRTGHYDFGTDYEKWKQYLDEKGPNAQPK